VGCFVAADGQIMVDEDEFDEFGDSKCSLCQRRFEEQGKIYLSHIYLFDMSITRKAIRKRINEGERKRETGPSLPKLKMPKYSK